MTQDELRSQIVELPHDESEIYQVVLRSENIKDYEMYTVGRNHITKIVAYYECGQMAAVPWFAVYKDGKINTRFDAVNCIVAYKEHQ